ncbi:MAG: hypothetical protein Q8Q67_01395 [bacterium]|nr:hypothetical protein [bacterium]
MKNAENVNVSKDKKSPRAGTKKSAEALLDRTEEIQAWADQIMNAQGAVQKKLRDEFKQEFGQVYNAKLLDRLKIRKPEQELINKAKDLIQQAVTDQVAEKEVAGTLDQVEGYNKASDQIDTERKAVVEGSIEGAARASGLEIKPTVKKVLDKIFKGEPYFDEIELELTGLQEIKHLTKSGVKDKKNISSKISFSDREAAAIARASASRAKNMGDKSTETIFPNEDPSQESDPYPDLLVQAASAELEEIKRAQAEEAKSNIDIKNQKPQNKRALFSAAEQALIDKARANSGKRGRVLSEEGDVTFPQEDPSQDIDQYAKTLAQMQAAELAEKEEAAAEGLKEYQEDLVDEEIERDVFKNNESAEERDIREAKERMDKFVNQRVDDTLAGFAAEDEAATQEAATLDVAPETQTTAGTEPISLDNTNVDGADKNVPSASTEPTVEAGQESSKYFEDAVEIFNSLNISSKDLDTIPGFENMNAVSQLLVAKSLKSLSLERARAKVEDDKAQAVGAKKTWVGKVFAGIGNSFRLGKMEKKAATAQTMGGLEGHGADLTRLAEWANTFDLKEKKNEDGEPQVSFINNLDLGSLNQEQFQLVADFDDYANILAEMPKHWLKKEGSVPDGSQEHKQSVRYERAKQQYELLRAQMGDLMANKLDLGERFAMQELNAADAKVNMMQLMAANPELEKEWSQMLRGSSMIKRAFKDGNWKFMAAGFVGRTGAKIGLGGVFGAAVGFIAVPAVAVVISGWRAIARAKKQLISSDRFIDKKDINQSDLFTQRQMALNNLQALEPSKYVDNPMAGMTLKGQREAWKQNLPAEELAKYEAALAVYTKANSAWEKEEGKNTEHKVLKADDLIVKLEGLADKYHNENERDKYKLLQDQLARRVIFTKNMADRGLVNFGSKEERTAQSLKFYQALARAQWFVEKYKESNATYGRTAYVEQGESGDLVEQRIEIDMKKRAETLLASIEAMSEKKLDAKRRAYVKRMMYQGAVMGGAFALAGAAVGELTGHWVSDRVGGGFRFVKDAIFNKGGAAAAVVTEAASETASSSVESTVSESATTDAVETAATASQAGSAQAAESAAESSAESAASSAGAGSTATEAVTTAQKVAAETAAASGESTAWVNKIDQAGDSVWRSTREIFKDMAAELGYTGDLNDSSALSRWAELQTNQALANSGELTDKVFIGNEIVLERSGDGFVVSVEAAAGATPGFREAAEEIADAAAASAAEPVITPEAPDLEALADAAGSKYGLSPEEVVATDRPNIIQTIINGHDVFVNIVENTFTYFNGADDEVSGLLVDAAGNPVTDLKAFLAEGLTLGDEGLLDPGVLEAGLDEVVDVSEAGIRESANNIGLFMLEHSSSSLETLYNQVLGEIEEATGLESLKEVMTPKEGRIFRSLIDKIHEDGYSAVSHQKALSKFLTRMVTKYGE